jgi:hypothetical protein
MKYPIGSRWTFKDGDQRKPVTVVEQPPTISGIINQNPVWFVFDDPLERNDYAPSAGAWQVDKTIAHFVLEPNPT